MKKEYEKSVIFRLGRILTGGPRGPGVFFIIPCVDIYQVLIHTKFNFVLYPSSFVLTSSGSSFLHGIQISPCVQKCYTKNLP